MLKDEDPRIRNEAIKTICDLAIQHVPKLCQIKYSLGNHLTSEFMLSIASVEIPYLLDNQRDWYLNGIENNDQSRKNLGKCLFHLTNMLLEMQSKEQLVSVGLLIYNSEKYVELFNFTGFSWALRNV